MDNFSQLDMFETSVLEAISKSNAITDVYTCVAASLGIGESEVNKKVFAGSSAGYVSAWKRKVRWVQQDLKAKGLIENISRGHWDITGKGKRLLTAVRSTGAKIAFTTDLGMVVWGDASLLPKYFQNEVDLLLTSPPYLLTSAKEYGGTSDSKEYIDTFLKWAEGWCSMLSDTGSIVINIGDAWNKGAYSQSLYKERLLIALEDKLGLHLVQRFEWWSPNKLPNPIDPVCKRRTHCVPALESFFWLSLNPEKVKASNRKVLVEYSASTKRLQASQRKLPVSIRPSGNKIDYNTFNKDNGGAIPHNLLCTVPDGSNTEYTRYCREKGLPIHPARFPIALPDFFIKYLTDAEDLVADPFFGSGRTALSAQKSNRRWIGSERILEYIKGSIGEFSPWMDQCLI